jgi:iron-sulfur cluster insertion protein
MIELTESAKTKIAEIIRDENKPNLKLRAYIEGGGCSGLNYGFALEEQKAEDDFVFEAGEFEVLIDAISMEYLRGAKIDFKKTMMTSSFVISNPNAKATCGCGSSFSA